MLLRCKPVVTVSVYVHCMAKQFLEEINILPTDYLSSVVVVVHQVPYAGLELYVKPVHNCFSFTLPPMGPKNIEA